MKLEGVSRKIREISDADNSRWLGNKLRAERTGCIADICIFHPKGEVCDTQKTKRRGKSYGRDSEIGRRILRSFCERGETGDIYPINLMGWSKRRTCPDAAEDFQASGKEQ